MKRGVFKIQMENMANKIVVLHHKLQFVSREPQASIFVS